MMRFLTHGRLDKIDKPERDRIRKALASSDRITLSQHSARYGIDPAALLVALLACAEDKISNLALRIYHNCEAHPVITCNYFSGAPTLPFNCPECEETITDISSLRFDVEGISKSPIDMVE